MSIFSVTSSPVFKAAVNDDPILLSDDKYDTLDVPYANEFTGCAVKRAASRSQPLPVREDVNEHQANCESGIPGTRQTE